MNCGEQTAGEIDKEVMQILKVAYDKAIALLQDNMEALDRISEYLIENETITGKQFMKIFYEVKGIPCDEDGKPIDFSTGLADRVQAVEDVQPVSQNDSGVLPDNQ